MSKDQYIANKPDELLDWVDDNDQVIGQVVRKIANSDPKFIHREVGILVLDENNRVLLQKRSKFKTVHPGMWSITAGHISSGDEPLATAHIELEEELGFDTDLVFLEKELHHYEHETHFMNYYLAKYSDQQIRMEEAEVEKVQFFSKDELEELISSKKEQVNLKHIPIIKKVLIKNNQ